MKKFEEVVMDVEKFDIADVITVSGECEWHCNGDSFDCPNGTNAG